MANRHLARSLVLQTLFELDMAGRRIDEAESILKRNTAEFASGVEAGDFSERLLKMVLDKQKKIDEIISKAAPDWPLEKISPIDRNVLRIGLAELIFADREEVPAKVAINEAIELAKAFGGESSGRFVNGVLGSVYKELGEPGKNAPKKRRSGQINRLPVEVLGGAFVFARDGQEIRVALVHDIFGHWTLSKGRIGDRPELKGETLEAGTVRSIKEELGLPIKVIDHIGANEYIASHPEKGKIKKQVNYFLAEAPFTDIKLEEKGGLDDARWFSLNEILDLNFYDDILPIVTKGVQLLAKIDNTSRK
jgi:N utilization substance protein B